MTALAPRSPPSSGPYPEAGRWAARRQDRHGERKRERRRETSAAFNTAQDPVRCSASPSCPHTHTHTHSHTNTHSHTLSYTHSHTHTHFLHSARLPTRLEPLEGRERAPALCSAHTSPRRGSAVPQTGKWSVLSPHQPSDSCSDISFVRGNASPSLLSFFKVMVVF